jgi:hypothetical protein
VSRFPKPILDLLTLANGDTITVRRVLTHGETTAWHGRTMTLTEAGTLRPDPVKYNDGLIVAYLVDWTIRDDAGDLVPIRGLSPEEIFDVINNLDHESAVEIRTAIEAHVEAQKQKRITEKKTEAAPLLLATSP